MPILTDSITRTSPKPDILHILRAYRIKRTWKWTTKACHFIQGYQPFTVQATTRSTKYQGNHTIQIILIQCNNSEMFQNRFARNSRIPVLKQKQPQSLSMPKNLRKTYYWGAIGGLSVKHMKHNSILSVHSVHNLGEYNWVGSLDHTICHLHSSLCRQTMHKVGLWTSDVHHGFINLQDRRITEVSPESQLHPYACIVPFLIAEPLKQDMTRSRCSHPYTIIIVTWYLII
jgi:hypothetical protein